ncbi:MAG: hypothetical protein A2Y12_06615 [Planctomycetes bacterium GWF2_42_9]|nr:MAG: hypothetical protein A2Y12_06615 [Planctomycetes bacterium GWF2_42_9]HAL44974.1 hypothetical protein [Phycisphaerales bacterium]
MTIQINDDIGFQKKIWVLERIFWVLLFLFIVICILGVFGQSPFGPASIEKNDLKITYDKFLKFKDPSTIKIIIPANANPVLGISKDYMESLEEVSFIPFPDKNFYADNQIKYIFMADQSKPIEITISFNAGKNGKLKGYLKNNGTVINFSQYVYP